MLQSLKNKYNYSEKISEDILEHWIHQKSHIIYKSFNYQQTWDFFYSHLGSPFNQPKIYEV